jgi:ribonuclease R
MMTRRGFGFVVPDGTGRDLHVDAEHMGEAIHGDRVRVRVRRGRRGREGEIVEVLDHSVHFLSGTLRRAGNKSRIEPEDERLAVAVAVSGELPEKAVAESRVIAEIVRYPGGRTRTLAARVVAVCDPARPLQFEILKTLTREGIREPFPEEVLAEAARPPRTVSRTEKKNREDLRGLDLVTIDPEDARDHDDAVWARRLSGGRHRLVVAIADVSHYVSEEGELDREALRRGCSIYLPDRVIAMLPERLSNHLASLAPGRDRLTLAVEMEVGARGKVIHHRFVEGVMRSRARLSYGGVARALGFTDNAPVQKAAEARRAHLRTLYDLSVILGERRKRRGALFFDLPEVAVRLDPRSGEPLSIEKRGVDPGIARAYGMIEELMLLANEVVATELTARAVPAIYRVHPPPDREKIEAFVEVGRSLGFSIDEDICRHPKKLSRLVRELSGTPHARVLSYLLLRAMQQAVYGTDAVGHFALALENYLHFTSPIRRYPDLVVHRIVRRLIRGEPIDKRSLLRALAPQAERASAAERRALTVEREVGDLYRAHFMRDRVGEVFDAVIASISDHGIFCCIDSPFVDVLCRTDSLIGDRYQADRHGLKLTGHKTGKTYRIGDGIRVRIADVSVVRRRVLAEPVEKTVRQGTTPQDTTPATGKNRKKGEPKPRRTDRSRRGRRRSR